MSSGQAEIATTWGTEAAALEAFRREAERSTECWGSLCARRPTAGLVYFDNCGKAILVFPACAYHAYRNILWVTPGLEFMSTGAKHYEVWRVRRGIRGVEVRQIGGFP